MKIALLQPEPSEKYKDQNQAYGTGARPPETGLAVLSSWINYYSPQLPYYHYNGEHNITILDPRKSLDELTIQASQYEFLGMTDWFTNHDNCVLLANRIKKINPNIKVVLGGQNAGCVGKETLANNKSIDYAVKGDGEITLFQLVNGLFSPPMIENLFYRRNNGEILQSYAHNIGLDQIPLWDFSCFENANERLADYLEAQRQGQDPWLVSPLTLFSFRGCTKAMREGLCSYCSSAETKGRALPPEKFWQQVLHLNKLYGAETFYMADDIFTISSGRIRNLAGAKPTDAKSKIRAYSYMPDLVKLPQAQLEEIAQDLNKIGVFNLFFGSENYDENVLAQANKKGVSVEESARVIRTLNDFGNVRTTIAYMFGLPGESGQSLRTNVESFRKLLAVDDCIERLYISVAMPLKGTPWCKALENDKRVLVDYQRQTGKDLLMDDSPDYQLLLRLAIKYQTSVTPSQINETVQTMVAIAREKIPAHKVGGFMLGV